MFCSTLEKGILDCRQQGKTDHKMSYLVHCANCALSDLIDELPDVDCHVDEVGGVEVIHLLAAELQHLIPCQRRRGSSSLPGNLIQETLALPIGKLTRSH